MIKGREFESSLYMRSPYTHIYYIQKITSMDLSGTNTFPGGYAFLVSWYRQHIYINLNLFYILLLIPDNAHLLSIGILAYSRGHSYLQVLFIVNIVHNFNCAL